MSFDLRPFFALALASAMLSACTHTSGSGGAAASADPDAASPAASSLAASPGASGAAVAASPAASIAAVAASPAPSGPTPLVLGGPSPSPASSPSGFDDISGSQHAAAIEALAQLGVLDSTTGHFKPDVPIERRDFVRWLYKTNNAVFANLPSHVVHPAQSNDPSDFTDVAASDPDFQYIEGMSAAGISVGFPDKTFKADQPITREQALAIKSALDFGGVDHGLVKDTSYARYTLPQWKDRADVSVTYVAALAQDVSQENDKGVDNIGRTWGSIVSFHPQKPLSRAEAAEMLQIIGGHDSNMAYADVMRTVADTLHPTPAPT